MSLMICLIFGTMKSINNKIIMFNRCSDEPVYKNVFKENLLNIQYGSMNEKISLSSGNDPKFNFKVHSISPKKQRTNLDFKHISKSPNKFTSNKSIQFKETKLESKTISRKSYINSSNTLKIAGQNLMSENGFKKK